MWTAIFIIRQDTVGNRRVNGSYENTFAKEELKVLKGNEKTNKKVFFLFCGVWGLLYVLDRHIELHKTSFMMTLISHPSCTQEGFPTKSKSKIMIVLIM